MYNYIFNLKKRQIENFAKYDVTKKFEDNTKIDTSMMINSVQKIMSNVTNEIVQNNSATVANSAGASNTILFSNMDCSKELNIDGINQSAESNVTSISDIKQENISNVANDISNNIKKEISKASSLDIQGLKSANNDEYEKFKKDTPGLPPPRKCTKLAFGLASSCSGGGDYTLNDELKKSFELKDTFTVNEDDEFSTDIKNIISQTNLSSCNAAASAQNQIILDNIKASRCNIKDIDQKAFAKLYAQCSIEQLNKSDVASKIVNSIKKNYNQVFKGIADKANEIDATEGPAKAKEYYDKMNEYLEKMSAADIDYLHAKAGNLKPVDKVTESQPESQPESESRSQPETQTETETQPESETQASTSKKSDYTNEIIISSVIGGVVILLFIGLIILLIKRKKE